MVFRLFIKTSICHVPTSKYNKVTFSYVYILIADLFANALHSMYIALGVFNTLRVKQFGRSAVSQMFVSDICFSAETTELWDKQRQPN